ncbi:MAG: flagellar basal body L-ring protein FlgH [Acidobacteria bacterium]|nr:flagellar basal body L-ring protein FlgH [Acidobacteriota bacterium]
MKILLLLLMACVPVWCKKSKEPCAAGVPARKDCTPLDQYVLSVEADGGRWLSGGSPGSLFAAGGRMVDLGRDFRAAFAGDIVTVLVSDRASAVARGTTNSSRASSASAGVSAALGPLRAEGPLGKLAGTNSDTKLQGQGETSRSTQLTATVTAVVEKVLPNGNLVLRGSKEIAVNSERQIVEVRGVVRPEDLQAGNSVASDRLAMLEVRVNGKGVVGDSIRRPNILYRILMGVLPF